MFLLNQPALHPLSTANPLPALKLMHRLPSGKKDNKVRPGHGRHRPETKAKIDRPSKSGSDLWEMVEYSDPFSVHYGTTSPIEGHPEFSSSSMAIPNSFSAVSTVSLSTEGPDQLDDCRGSDYEVHSNSGNDNDSDSWEDVTEDSGARRFQFVDPVAEMLDSVVLSNGRFELSEETFVRCFQTAEANVI